MKKLITLGLLGISLLSLGYNSTSKETKKLGLTIYNGGFAVVKETRKLNINKNDEIVNYKDVAEEIESDSIIVDGVNILELNYEYDLASKKQMLSKYLGKKIYIKDKEKKKEYRLLSVNNGIVLENMKTKEILLDPEGQIILPKLSGKLKVKPALVWKIEKNNYEDDLNISYITKKINWEANYVLNLKGDKLNLIGWVNIENNSGKTFKNTNLKLVAGEVKRATERPEMIRYATMKKTASLGKNQFKEEAFFDYHIYNLERKTNLRNQQSKQIKFVKENNINYKKYYKFSNHQNKVNIILEFENNNKNNLGIPLPKGKVKVYKEQNGVTEFVGEDNIIHTPKDEKIKLNIGNSFDIKAAFRELNNKKLSKRSFEKEIEYEIKNHKNEDITIQLEYNLYGEWEILETTDSYKKESNQKIIFEINVPKNSNKKVIFKYRMKY